MTIRMHKGGETEAATSSRGLDGGAQAARIYNKLRDLIVHGGLAPGTRVTEADVAVRLGASRTPVRSALQRLHQEGYLVVSRRHRRSRVTVAALTRSDATELFNILAQIEVLAGRSAAGVPGPARTLLVKDLVGINHDFREAARRADSNECYRLDEAFHGRLFAAGAGPRLAALRRSIKPQADRYAPTYFAVLGQEILASVREHGAILRSLKTVNPDATQRAIEAHWRNTVERLGRMIDRVGERGHW